MKIQPLLNRLLLNLSRKNKAQSNYGFTLIELLVVVLIIGILSAIAAPTWDSLTSRQRLSSVNSRVFQAIKTAQAEAKRTKQDVTITFTTGTTTEAPKYTLSTAPNSPLYLNIEGQVKPDIVQVYPTLQGTSTSKIIFDHLGATEDAGFTVVTYLTNNEDARKCTIVETILGTLRTTEGTDCPDPTP